MYSAARPPIKVWRKDRFILRLWDTNPYHGQRALMYELKDKGEVIFKGVDFCPSRLHADDSLNTVYAVLSFLSLGKGDTDSEYFDDYTPRQLEWRDSDRREELSLLAYDGEARLENRRRK